VGSTIAVPSAARVPMALLEATELTPTEKLIGVALLAHLGALGNQRFAHTRLARCLGLCRQTVAAAVRRLEASGWCARGTPGGTARLASLAGGPLFPYRSDSSSTPRSQPELG
jgi:hypothetical protein